MPGPSIHQASRDCRLSLSVVENRHVSAAENKRIWRTRRYQIVGGSGIAIMVFLLLQMSRVFVG